MIISIERLNIYKQFHWLVQLLESRGSFMNYIELEGLKFKFSFNSDSHQLCDSINP